MNAKKMVVSGMVVVALVVMAGQAHAALLSSSVSGVSSEFVAIGRHAANAVNGSGLTGTGAPGSTHAQGENGITWTAMGDYGPDYDPEITFNLGAPADVTTMRIWNYNEAGINIIGPNDVNVYTSTDGIVFNLASAENFPIAPGAPGYLGSDIAVNYPGVQYIKFDIMTSHDAAVFDGTGTQGGTVDGRSLTGLSEVRFEGAYTNGLVIPTVVDVSSENPIGIDRAASHTVDGSGLSGIGNAGDTHIDNTDPGLAWTTVGNIGPGLDLDPYITYDLGEVADVKTMRIWNDNHYTFKYMGVADFEVFAGETLGTMTSRGIFTLDEATGLPDYTGQDFPVDFPGVRYVKFDILSNPDGAVFDGTGTVGGTDGRFLTGLAEVRFEVVPEPNALLLAGLGGLMILGSTLLRRRQV